MKIHDFFQSSESHLALCGSLRRLKDWHNATITLVMSQNALLNGYHGDVNQTCIGGDATLAKFVSAKTIGCFEEFDWTKDQLWRGKISVIDKTVRIL